MISGMVNVKKLFVENIIVINWSNDVWLYEFENRYGIIVVKCSELKIDDIDVFILVMKLKGVEEVLNELKF